MMRYRYGFNGMEKENAVNEDGCDFGARVYNSWNGKWLAVDAIVKPYLSSYQFGRGNPIIFIDPDGNTEFYFNGKWIGSDGVNNDMIRVVKSKSIRNAIKKNTKEGLAEYYVDTESNTDNVFVINKFILQEAINVLQKTIDLGGDREITTVMDDCGDGTFVSTPYHIGEASEYKKNEVVRGGSISSEDGSISIHSHPLGYKEDENDKSTINVHYANEPGPNDPAAFSNMEINIIVGKNRPSKLDSGFTKSDGRWSDNRELYINKYDKNTHNKGTVSFDISKKIMKNENKK
jgi:RHS repeat-associated protein